MGGVSSQPTPGSIGTVGVPALGFASEHALWIICVISLFLCLNTNYLSWFQQYVNVPGCLALLLFVVTCIRVVLYAFGIC